MLKRIVYTEIICLLINSSSVSFIGVINIFHFPSYTYISINRPILL